MHVVSAIRKKHHLTLRIRIVTVDTHWLSDEGLQIVAPALAARSLSSE